MKLTVTLF